MTTKMNYRKMALLGSTMVAGAVGALLATVQPARAFNVYNGEDYGNNLEINLTTTLSYTPIVRVGNPSKILTSPTGNANGSEADLNFQHGLVSNEFEITPELDIKDGNYGAFFSGEAFINTSYLGTNQNNQPGTVNAYSVARNNDFTSATRNLDGLYSRLLDAFVYGSVNFGANNAQTLTVKIGRQTLLWGQSLFLTNNGIAAGMAPIDTITAFNTPNAQTQQVIMPVGQAVFTYQPNQIVTIQGYYQAQWEPDNFQGEGAYFASTDAGLNVNTGQRLILAPGAYLYHTKDLTPPNNNGQFGLSTQLTLGNYDIGFYGLRYDAKAPVFYGAFGVPTLTKTGVSLGSWRAAYGRDIWIEGASFSTTIGAVNVAGEISFRQHMPLTTGLDFVTPTSNANSNPAYPTGNTWAAQSSFIYVSPGIPLDPGGVSVDGEIGMNHVLAITANKAAIDSVATGAVNRSSTAAQFVLVATPEYYNVLPNLQLGFPVGISYDFYGRSMVDPTENNGTGSVNVGITATYDVKWIASLTYQDEIGAPNPLMQGEPSIADRSYVLANLQYSF